MGRSSKRLVWYEKKVTLCIRIVALAKGRVIPIFPNPTRFLQEQEGKKKRPVTNTLTLTNYCETGPLTPGTQKHGGKLNSKNRMENLADVWKRKYLTKTGKCQKVL